MIDAGARLHGHLARWWPWSIVVGAAILARVQFDVATSDLIPRAFPDSREYIEIAAQPFDLAHLFYPKPLLVPAIYRWFEGDFGSIAAFQREFAFWSWLALALVLCGCARRWPARLLGLGLGLAFLLAPFRVGWTGVILSESINDSLLADLTAIGVLLVTVATRLGPGPRRTRWCGALAATLFLLASAWVLARDTNAVVMVVAAPLAWLVWSSHRAGERRWPAVLAAATVAVACFALWTAQVVPRQPLGLTLTAEWDPVATSRAALPRFNNLFARILPDAEARAYFVDRGMPMPDALAAFGVPVGSEPWDWNPAALAVPGLAEPRAWLATAGTMTYLGWLIQHPLDRLGEVVRAGPRLLAPPILAYYMPLGWLRDLVWFTTDSTIILVFLAITPFWLWSGRSVFLGVAACLVVSGAVGIVACYYGDAVEIERHCYGASQQVILGAMLAFVGWVEGGALDRLVGMLRSVRRRAVPASASHRALADAFLEE